MTSVINNKGLVKQLDSTTCLLIVVSNTKYNQIVTVVYDYIYYRYCI